MPSRSQIGVYSPRDEHSHDILAPQRHTHRIGAGRCARAHGMRGNVHAYGDPCVAACACRHAYGNTSPNLNLDASAYVYAYSNSDLIRSAYAYSRRDACACSHSYPYATRKG